MKLVALGAIAGITVATATGFYGYHAGQAACELEHKAALLAEIEAGQKLEEERLAIAEERDQLARKLEEEAHADPVTVELCLSPDRVRRLNAIR